VKEAIGSDSRIGKEFLNVGPGFGGNCFEKDILSLVHILDTNGEHQAALYWQNVLDLNNHQKLRLAKILVKDFKKQFSQLNSIPVP
jgi:UDPglucose 6-dehydrogenase